MSENVSTPTPSTPDPERARRRRFLRRTAIVAVIAVAATGLGLFAATQARSHGGWHCVGFMGGPLGPPPADPAAMEARLDRILKHLYVEIDPTDAQKQQIAPIVRDAMRDLAPVRGRLHEARRRALELLTRESIDRGALEALRAEQVALVTQASARFVQALADLGDVLTVEQRRQLVEHVGRWHGRRG